MTQGFLLPAITFAGARGASVLSPACSESYYCGAGRNGAVLQGQGGSVTLQDREGTQGLWVWFVGVGLWFWGLLS